MTKAWSDEAWEEFLYWVREDKKIVKRILLLLQDIERNGNIGIGKPERLIGEFSSYWSRRIDDKHRLVYRVDSNTIKIIQCGTHYRDK
ncbi:MAG: Txe/YoeB family addiction module toxin [Sphaerochaetaceae bacterium]|jgi:toxin YoeB